MFTQKNRETRKDLIELFYGFGAEVGVADGDYSLQILKNKKVKFLFGIDPYIPYKGYTDYTRPHTFAGMKAHARDKLINKERYEFINKLSMDAVKQFDDNTLDFVYIDANHKFDYVMEDIIEWTKKVRPGGIVAGHDYDNSDVEDAVTTYVNKHSKDLVVYAGELPQSWMFIK